MRHKEPLPQERDQTIRHAILTCLREGPHTSRDISSRVGIPEKEVAAHLEHLRRSLRHQGLDLQREDAQCLSCGFVFAKRTRFTKPSSCPRCHGQRIEPPNFWTKSREAVKLHSEEQ